MEFEAFKADFIYPSYVLYSQSLCLVTVLYSVYLIITASLSFDSDILPFSNLDDISFNLAMFELDNGPVNFDADRLASLNYNPLFSDTN